MRSNFQTLAPDEPLATALAHLHSGFQQEFPVVSDHTLFGILTREDLIRAVQNSGAEALVGDVIQRRPAPVDSHDMLDRVMSRLRESRVLPVTHQGRLVGMLTMENMAEFLMIQAAAARATGSPNARARGQE